MGYTHYYSTKPALNKTSFKKVAIDFKKMIPVLDHLGVKLADGFGENTPIITPNRICFNGLVKCGHEEKNLGITWPKPQAKGVLKNSVGTTLEQITKSNWFAGAELETRACGGDCSHETFEIESKMSNIPEWKQEDLKAGKHIFGFTKTAYKPYDLAVNVCLIIAKHYLKKDIQISSDGEMVNWEEGMQLCQHFLGYGADFSLDGDEE